PGISSPTPQLPCTSLAGTRTVACGTSPMLVAIKIASGTNWLAGPGSPGAGVHVEQNMFRSTSLPASAGGRAFGADSVPGGGEAPAGGAGARYDASSSAATARADRAAHAITVTSKTSQVLRTRTTKKIPCTARFISSSSHHGYSNRRASVQAREL